MIFTSNIDPSYWKEFFASDQDLLCSRPRVLKADRQAPANKFSPEERKRLSILSTNRSMQACHHVHNMQTIIENALRV